MKRFWGLLFLLACSPEYGISNNNNVADPIVDTAVEQQTIPPVQMDVPTPPEETYAAIHIEPYDYDFGEVDVNCEYEYDVVITSIGTEPLIIDSLDYMHTPELELVGDYKYPIYLKPGDTLVLTFKYHEVDLIADTGRMFIYSNALGKREQMITHQGIGVATGNQVDVFEQEEISKADILFVIDNSCSMSHEQAGMAGEAESFIDDLIGASIDFEISVITTDSPTPVSPSITPDSADPVGDFSRAVSVGTGGDATEMGQEMSKQALDPVRGTIQPREDAALSVVVVSDEDDFSPLTELEYYDFFLSIKEEELFFFHSVISTEAGCGTAIGDRYIDQSLLTGGMYLDICSPWGDNLNTIANSNYIIATEYPLSKEAVPGTVEVFLDGTPLKSGWHYNIGSNSVILDDRSLVSGEEMFQVMYDYLGDCPL
jgi:hypothetical protein